jgi:hypothetical protein
MKAIIPAILFLVFSTIAVTSQIPLASAFNGFSAGVWFSLFIKNLVELSD